MQGEFSIGEISRGRIYHGTLILGTGKFYWLLVFTVPMSKMNGEVAHRKKSGQDVSSKKVKNELFTLVVLNQDWCNVDLGEFGDVFLAAVVGEAANFHGAPISDIWRKISGGTCPSPFKVMRAIEVDENTLPETLLVKG